MPSTCPAEPSACTSITGGREASATVVSNPLRGWVAVWLSVAVLAPESTRQLVTWVAPFQLAYTTSPRPPDA